MPSIIGVFKVDVLASLTLFPWEAGGVEEGVILSIDDEGREVDFVDAILAAALEIVVHCIAVATEGGCDVVVKVDEVLDFVKIHA